MIRCSIISLTLLAMNMQPALAQRKPGSSGSLTIDSVQYGIASYYSDAFVGRKTASGEVFSQEKMTTAHNSLPLGTWIRVTNLRNGREVEVKVNDRLHHRNKRLLDHSRSAAGKLGYLKSGITRVKLDVIRKKSPAESVKTQ